MSQLRFGTVVYAVALSAVLSSRHSVIAQCPPTEPNVRCWASSAPNEFYSNADNWDPPIVPVDGDKVYHLMGGTITYDVTNPINQTIASFTAGGTAEGLIVSQGLPLTIVGNMESNGAVDYELTVKPSVNLIVNGNIRDVKVKLESGTSNDETTVHIATDVTGGDWFIPRFTRVIIDGNVDATGPREWNVGTYSGAPVDPNDIGGTLAINGNTRDGTWLLQGSHDPAAGDPLPEIRVSGTIEGGCWSLHAPSCPNPDGMPEVKTRWSFGEFADGPNTNCFDLPFPGLNLVTPDHFCELDTPANAVISGGYWKTDSTLFKNKVMAVTGGIFFLHQSGRVTIDGQTYVPHFGTFNPDAPLPSQGDCSLGNPPGCSVYTDSFLIISGPGDSYVPSMYMTHGNGSCFGHGPEGGFLETSDGATHCANLTIGTLIANNGNGPGALAINRESSGATETNMLIQESATLIKAIVNAKTLTVHGPTSNDASQLEMYSPDRVPSVITLAGPADLGAVGQFELLYYNRDNTIASRAGTGPNAFTLGEKAVIRAGESKGAPNLNLIATGDVDVKTEFPYAWVNEGGLGDPQTVGQQWDTRTTNLTLLGLIGDVGGSLGLVTTKLELFSADYGPYIFSDTPCRGALGTLHIRTDNGAHVELVDAHTNQPPGVSETLYVKNIIIDPNASLEVHSFVIYYTNQMSILGQVTREGVVLNPHEHENIFIRAEESVYGDFNFDGPAGDDKDKETFCEFENVGYYVLGIVDGNCDGLVNDLDKAMMIANMREPDHFECPE